MRTSIVAGMAVLAMACAGAQESHNSSQALQPKVTLVGCLQEVDRPGEPVGTIGSKPGSAGSASEQRAAGAGSPGERFTLTNARSESAESNPAAASYVLDGDMEDLRELANQQVRLTGTVDATAANTAGPQRVRVDRVESVAARCAR
jgi:hypothetical protein